MYRASLFNALLCGKMTPNKMRALLKRKGVGQLHNKIETNVQCIQETAIRKTFYSLVTPTHLKLFGGVAPRFKH